MRKGKKPFRIFCFIRGFLRLRKYKMLDLQDRKMIEKMYMSGAHVFDIAEALGVHQSTVYRELERGRTGRIVNGKRAYNPDVAQKIIDHNLKTKGRKGARVQGI